MRVHFKRTMHTDTPVSAKRKLQTERSYYDELDAGM